MLWDLLAMLARPFGWLFGSAPLSWRPSLAVLCAVAVVWVLVSPARGRLIFLAIRRVIVRVKEALGMLVLLPLAIAGRTAPRVEKVIDRWAFEPSERLAQSKRFAWSPRGAMAALAILLVSPVAHLVMEHVPAWRGSSEIRGLFDRWFEIEAQLGLHDAPVETAASIPVVYRPTTGEWFGLGDVPIVWGQLGDIPVPADYDGDGLMERAVFRTSTGEWLVGGRESVRWGEPGDIPSPADYDGDGAAEFAIFRPTTGEWWVLGRDDVVVWGQAGDLPVAGRYQR